MRIEKVNSEVRYNLIGLTERQVALIRGLVGAAEQRTKEPESRDLRNALYDLYPRFSCSALGGHIASNARKIIDEVLGCE
jgi:hypothetical protein